MKFIAFRKSYCPMFVRLKIRFCSRDSIVLTFIAALAEKLMEILIRKVQIS